STNGTLPDSSVLSTSSACLVQVAVISFRYLACGSPAFFCSGIETATLPASSTTWPSSSSRASSPATRTADGPMSTPRRDWPRSSGTPITRILRGRIFVNGTAVVVIGIQVLTGLRLLRRNGQQQTPRLRIKSVQHPRKRDRL